MSNFYKWSTILEALIHEGAELSLDSNRKGWRIANDGFTMTEKIRGEAI